MQLSMVIHFFNSIHHIYHIIIDTAIRQYLSTIRNLVSSEATTDILRFLDDNNDTNTSISNTCNTNTITSHPNANDSGNTNSNSDNSKTNISSNENIDNANIEEIIS